MTYYEILEVSENASEEVVKMAYKALVKKYHPDVFKGNQQIAEEKIKEINKAFDVLSNVQKRKEYDDWLYKNRQKNKSNETPRNNQTNQESAPTQKRTAKVFYTICFVTVLALLSGISRFSNLFSNNDYDVDDYESSPPIYFETFKDTGVEWISDYRFLYYNETSEYVLLFELSDENENAISADGAVDIRIVNDSGATVYKETREFSSNNFEEWIYDEEREVYVAAIYIEPGDMVRGNTASGMVYFKVSGWDYSFEELSYPVYDLPSVENVSSNGNVSPQLGYTCLDYTCDSDFCILCECYNPVCKNVKADQGLYCMEHTCYKLGCNNEKNINSNYCILHD